MPLQKIASRRLQFRSLQLTATTSVKEDAYVTQNLDVAPVDLCMQRVRRSDAAFGGACLSWQHIAVSVHRLIHCMGACSIFIFRTPAGQGWLTVCCQHRPTSIQFFWSFPRGLCWPPDDSEHKFVLHAVIRLCGDFNCRSPLHWLEPVSLVKCYAGLLGSTGVLQPVV